jgi:hypothetical protein
MKKLVFASVMALASISLVYAPTLRAQDSDQITIKDPAEFNAYQVAITQSDPAAKASALEGFLQSYPQSVVKKAVLDALIDVYQGLGNGDKALGAASRLLQVDPNNMKAIFISVFIKKGQCAKTSDAQVCDDAAALAQKGLSAPKGDGVSDADWKKLTDATYPAYHSAIALDDMLSKKDSKAAIAEYRTELMLFSAAATTSGPGLVDTLQLAEAYAKPDARDMVLAAWFYARAWNFAPPAYKAQIEPKLEYWYKRYHGGLDGLEAVKSQAAGTLFPPGTFKIDAAPTPPEIAHKVVVDTPDLTKLNLEDKEFILANGTKEDADKLWALLKGQATPVPGVVIEANASAVKVAVTQAGKTADFVVHLTTPVACAGIPEAGADIKPLKDFVLASGVKEDTDKVEALSPDYAKPVKLAIEGTVPVIKVAVTQDAKDTKVADFIVNLKAALPCKEVPAAGFEFKLQPASELDATYDTYAQVPATATKGQTAQIALRDGFVQAEKKKVAAPVHKPAAGHRPAH